MCLLVEKRMFNPGIREWAPGMVCICYAATEFGVLANASCLIQHSMNLFYVKDGDSQRNATFGQLWQQ